MNIQIEQKIVSYDIVEPQSQPQQALLSQNQSAESAQQSIDGVATNSKSAEADDNIVRMHEKVERPEMLLGSTYKIKTPVSTHAFYISINDIVLNPDTPHEKRRPFEMFINSKNMDHYQWISALTRIVSAVFRKGGDITFLVDELQSIFDPKGGYFRKGGKYMPSLVAEIGDAIESHLKMIGLITAPRLDKHQQEMVTQKRNQYEQQQALKQEADGDAPESSENAFPSGAQLCDKCHNKAMIVMDNCLTCLNCGESKCG